jgi:RNA polymerase sigma factor (TIGR02999 family)
MAFSIGEVTQLLIKWSSGDKAALDELTPIVYAELRRLAKRRMRTERQDHTLQTSALINEAYMRLVDQKSVQWKDRSHFFAVSAQIMRHILVDHARKHQSDKRGAGAQKVPLDDATVESQRKARELIALDEALSDLAIMDARQSRVVELRFFGGLTVEETAEVLEISPITVKRDWRTAKAWLRGAITKSNSSISDTDAQ